MFKNVLKITVLVLFAAFVVMQFFRPDFNNPPIIPENNFEAHLQVPENVRTIIKRSCADCHTSETVYPWYSKIQPAAWFLDDHIQKGREELNLSNWGTYRKTKQKRKLEEMCDMTKIKEMPLPSYLWIHRDAVMTDEDTKILCDWTKTESDKIIVEQ